MSFRIPEQSLRDILRGIAMIEKFTAGVSFERFREEPMRVAAGERYLLMISEAASRLRTPRGNVMPRSALAQYSGHWELDQASV